MLDLREMCFRGLSVVDSITTCAHKNKNVLLRVFKKQLSLFCVCVCVCVSVCLSVYLSVCLSVCLSVRAHARVRLCMYVRLAGVCVSECVGVGECVSARARVC